MAPAASQASPVSACFSQIHKCSLEKLRLSQKEQQVLHNAEDNPLDYTLANQEDAAAYARVLLKLLGEASISLGSSRVSRLAELLSEDEARKIMVVDPTGVMSHYTLAKLAEVVEALKERKPGSNISMTTTFYSSLNGSLTEEYRSLLRVLHIGGDGDQFAQRE